jgi:hypothetical protein
MHKEKGDVVARSFTNIVQGSADGIMEVANALLARGNRNIPKREYADVSMLLDIVTTMTEVVAQNSQLVHLLESRVSAGNSGSPSTGVASGMGALVGAMGGGTSSASTIPPPQNLVTWLDQANLVLLAFFRNFYDDLGDEDKRATATLAADGTVNELTSTTMNLLRRLQEYREEIDAMIQEMWPVLLAKGANFGNLPTSIKNYSDYELEVLSALLKSLEARSKGYKKPALAAIFLLNNYLYVG